MFPIITNTSPRPIKTLPRPGYLFTADQCQICAFQLLIAFVKVDPNLRLQLPIHFKIGQLTRIEPREEVIVFGVFPFWVHFQHVHAKIGQVTVALGMVEMLLNL